MDSREVLDHDVATMELSDGYISHYRLWGPSSGKDVIIMPSGTLGISRNPLTGFTWLDGARDASSLCRRLS